MAYVQFLDDKKFESIVCDILKNGQAAKATATKKFSLNVIDPFAILFEMASFNVDFDTWYLSEVARQSQKTLVNHIGTFHQRILGSVDGWNDLGVGKMIDLCNPTKRIIAEVKNKHNTLKGSNQVDLYSELADLVMPNGQAYKGYTSYYVEVIPKKPNRYNHPFTPSDKKTSTKCPSNELIRQIDGASFYALVTGHDNALEEIFNALPFVIKKCDPKISLQTAQRAAQYFKAAYQVKN